MPAEVEAKLLADGPEPLAALAAEERLGEAILGPPRTVDEVDRYLDTADGRLASAQWACRLRQRDGAVRVSMKGPPDARPTGSIHQRPEVEGPATSSEDPQDWPASPARTLLDQLRRGAPLGERFRLVQRRTERSVTAGGAIPLATLSLDAVVVHRGNHRAGELFAVELELRTDAGTEEEAALDRLADALALRPGLTPDPLTKLQHALELLGTP